MSIRIRILGTAAALLLVGAVSAADTLTAHAATPACSIQCLDLFSNWFGTAADPRFLLDARNQGQSTGTPVVLAPVSNSNPGEDFTVDNEGPVEDFYLIGLVSQGLAKLYGSLAAFEIQYSPSGASAGLCVGVGATPTAGMPVTLQPCGVSAKTIWIVDGTQSIAGSGYPLINGATDADFANPEVLTAAEPGDDLGTEPLTRFAFPFSLFYGPAVFPSQLWGTAEQYAP